MACAMRISSAGRVVVRARSCRNGARILDVADPCEVLQHWQDFSSQSPSPAAELIVGRSRDILYTPPKGSAMFPCEEAKSDQSCREGAEPRRAGSPRDVGAWRG